MKLENSIVISWAWLFARSVQMFNIHVGLASAFTTLTSTSTNLSAHTTGVNMNTYINTNNRKNTLRRTLFVKDLNQQTQMQSKLNFKPSSSSSSSLSSSSSQLYSSSTQQNVNEADKEFHPRDPAKTTPQLLSSLWLQIALGCKNLSKGETSTVLYPEMQSEFTQSYLQRLMGHLDVCKDVCDDFGVNTIITPYTELIMGRSTITGFTVKSYKEKDNSKVGTLVSDGNFQFAPDPMWDDDEWDTLEKEIEEAARADEEYCENELNSTDGSDGNRNQEDDMIDLPEIVNKVPDDDDALIDITKKWVAKMMSDMGVCPFTNGADMAGLPMGQVYYTVDRCASMEEMYATYWKEVCRVEHMPQKDLSTTLLIAPEFCLDNVELFENFCNSLTHPLESLQVEDLLQLVFFHPEWTFRDGGERSGMGSAANYARRSPWPMINILRTSQVRTAQRGIPTGLVYQQNEKTLNKIGTKSLEKMLRLRDWSDIADLKVDRKDMEALRVAQDLQTTGVVADEDKSFVFDSTPAANKVDRSQIEGGNIANVLLQALHKRLTGGPNGDATSLSGAETSAAMMASDFLLEYLDEIEISPPRKFNKNTMAQRYFDLDDEFSQDKVTEEDEGNVLFGGGGIMMNPNEENEPFGEGMDPRNFY